MFLYDENPKEKSLFVTIPSKIQYNFAFLNNITELLEQVEKSSYEKILIDCGTDPINYNKMCTAYLLNTLLFLAQTKTVFAKNNLLQIFHETVCHPLQDVQNGLCDIDDICTAGLQIRVIHGGEHRSSFRWKTIRKN